MRVEERLSCFIYGYGPGSAFAGGAVAAGFVAAVGFFFFCAGFFAGGAGALLADGVFAAACFCVAG
jgi:hypothetical protein